MSEQQKIRGVSVRSNRARFLHLVIETARRKWNKYRRNLLDDHGAVSSR